MSVKLSPADMSFTDRQNGVVKMALLAANKSNKKEMIDLLEKSKRSTKLPAPQELTDECVRHGLTC